MLNQETVKKVEDFLKYLTLEEAIADDKLVLREFFRKLVFCQELDSYAIDYSEDDFCVSIIKGKEEQLFQFNNDGSVDDLGSNME